MIETFEDKQIGIDIVDVERFRKKNFLEIGFHWFQFNCIGLIDKFPRVFFDNSILPT